jgi:hypothetical protein
MSWPLRGFILAVCFLFLLTSRQGARAGTPEQGKVPPTPPGAASPTALSPGEPALNQSFPPDRSGREIQRPDRPDDVLAIWPPAEDSLIDQPQPDINFGTNIDLWVRQGTHSLIRWDLSAVPGFAMVYYAEGRLRLINSSEADLSITAHAVTNSWTEGGVTWNLRDGISGWGNPGGDFEPLAESVTQVGTVLDEIYYWPLTDLVAEWHNGKRANTGILLKPEGASASQTKIFGSKDQPDPDTSFYPELDIYYVLGPVELSAYSPVTWGVPSPDWYQYNAGAGWSAVAMRPPAGSDYDLWLFSDPDFTNELIRSDLTSDAVDLVLVDGNHAAAGTYYPAVSQFNGRGVYAIEQGSSTSDLTDGVSGPYTMAADEVVRIWDTELNGGSEYFLAVRPATGDANLALELYQSNGGNPTTHFQNRNQAIAQSNESGAGGLESFSYSPGGTDRFGLVVLSLGATAETTYRVFRDTTAPSGSLSLAGGAQFVNSTSIPASISGSDGETGLYDMRFANGANPNGPWTDFAADSTWTIPAGDGAKTVYAQVRNGAAMLSGVFSDEIILDQTPPTGVQAACPATTGAEAFTVQWSGSDSTSGIATFDVQYRVGASGDWKAWRTGVTGDSATFGQGTPVGLQQGQTYFFRARATDQAGNTSDFASGDGDCSTQAAAGVGGSTFLPTVIRLAQKFAAPCSAQNGYCEDNDTIATAYGPLEEGVVYSAYPNDQEDLYYFELSSKRSITVQVTGYNAEGDLLIYAADNTSDAIGRWGEGGSNMTVDLGELEPGRYYVRVYTASGQNSSERYSLSYSD